MKELHDIVQAYDKAVLQGKRTALATVVKVVGSSYRRPGARMLVTEDGELTGAISGGCLEGDALRKAMLALMQNQKKLVIYDTTDEDDAKLGVQLGCNGIVSILFEPIQKEEAAHPINLLKKCMQQRKDAVLVTAFNENRHADQAGTCCFISENENISTTNNCEAFVKEGRQALEQKTSVVKEENNQSVLYQFITPTVQLVIAGAGNDAQPLVEMASVLGWQSTVVDGRSTHATARRFPRANKILVTKPEAVLSQIVTDGQTAFVLMTHNYNYDLALLGKLLTTECAYIGVLGPRKKLQRMLDEIGKNGLPITEEQLQKIYGPVGLDLGVETAEEIALSVVAEIKSVFAGRNAGSLRNKETAIHDTNALLRHE